MRTILPLALAPLLLFAGCNHPAFPTYPDGYREFAYIANSTGNTVTILDLVYLRPDRTISVGVDPVALAINPKRDEVYVVNAQPDQSAGSVSVIDTLKNAVVATIPVHRNPTAISVDASGQRAFVANTESNTVTEIDLDTRRAIASAATGNKPDAALIAPDGRTLVVTNRAGGSVSIYSTGIPPLGNKTTPITKVGYGPVLSLRATFSGCPGATSPVILPNSSKAFVACADSHQVMSISLAAAPDSWAAKQDATLTSDHVLALLDVGNNPTNLTLKPDGGEVFASNRDSDSISEILTETSEVASTYAIGNRPAHGVVSADNSALWVSNLGAESVSLYSIADGKFLSSIRTGEAPDTLAFGANEQLLLTADTRSGDVAVIRTTSRLGPALFTILPAGGSPVAIVVKGMAAKP
jgi:YVTN family beta-propeller protein